MSNSTFNFSTTNIDYLKEVLSEEDVDTYFRLRNLNDLRDIPDEELEIYDTVKRCLMTMERYDDNCWWLSNDPCVVAYFQVMEPVLLVPFTKFQSALSVLLGHYVWDIEIFSAIESLRNEADKAFDIYQYNNSE